MLIDDLTIYDFMQCWFKEDYSKLSKDDFDIAYSEYIDTAGLVFTAEFDLVALINYNTNRLNSIRLSVELHKGFLEEFQVAYPDFEIFNNYGHYIQWTGDKEKFIKDLDMILSREVNTEVELNSYKKKLEKERKESEINNGEKLTLKQSREQFIRMINSLCKLGFKIEKKETTVEELALMIKQQTEENDKYNQQSN